MNFNRHSNLEGQHAFLSASKFHWINYDSDKLFERYASSYVPMIGTVLHELAKKLIDQKMKLSKSDRKMVLFWLLDHKIPRSLIDMDFVFENFMNYVNDAIGFKMIAEQVLVYSVNCFGTADAIKFSDNMLRIHDYKSGNTPAHIEQLMIYAALFCLEYDVKPGEIQMELRIYQNGEILVHEPTAEDILPIMDKIVTFDKLIDSFKGEEK